LGAFKPGAQGSVSIEYEWESGGGLQSCERRWWGEVVLVRRRLATEAFDEGADDVESATFEAVARWAGTQDLSTHSVCLKVRERYSTVMLPILKPEVNRRKYLGPQRRMKSFTALHESMNTAGSRSAM